MEVGSEGRGYLWKNSGLDDAEEEELTQCIWGNTHTHTHLYSTSVCVVCVLVCVCMCVVCVFRSGSEV